MKNVMFEWFLGLLMLASALGVLFVKKPVYAGLSFLLTLISLSALYLQLSAHFIAAMQIFVYAGAIMVLFMFVIVLFQDAYQEIDKIPMKSSKPWRVLAASAFILAGALFSYRLIDYAPRNEILPTTYGTVQSLGKILFIDFFFPFEAVILLFLIALVGSIFIARKEN